MHQFSGVGFSNASKASAQFRLDYWQHVLPLINFRTANKPPAIEMRLAPTGFPDSPSQLYSSIRYPLFRRRYV
jgi:hypothetical protein